MKIKFVLFSLLVFFFLHSCVEDNGVTPEQTTPSLNQEFPLIEEIEVNGYIGTVSLPDTISVESVHFAIIGGDENEVFQIDKNNGDIFLEELATSKDADNEFELTISVTNNSTENNILNVELKITLSPTLFIYDHLKQIGYVDESCEQGYLVGTVASIDTTVKLDFRFDIFRGNHLGIFELNRQNGQLTVDNPSLIDYNSDSLHILNIVVSDYDNPKDSVLYYVNYYLN